MAKVLIGFDERKPGRHESTELSCRNSYDRSFIAQWLCQRCHNMEDFKIAIAYYNKELLFPNKEKMIYCIHDEIVEQSTVIVIR